MKNNESSLTSLVAAFSRAYHVKEDDPILFNDTVVQHFITEDEYNMIAFNMTKGIEFFSPEMSEKLKGDDAAILSGSIKCSCLLTR